MTKYLAALLNLTALMVVCVVIAMMIRPESVSAHSQGALARPAALAETAAPAAAGEAIARLRELEHGLEQINHLATEGVSGTIAPLAIGVEAPLLKASTSDPSGGNLAVPRPVQPTVSLIYLSSDMRRAVVDGDVVGVGDSLANGARVLSIEADRVIVDKKGRRTTLPVPQPRIVGGVLRQGAQQ